jgi:ribose 5-phosphate isomerase B
MQIHLASDHAGFELKQVLLKYIKSLGFDIVDHGAFKYNPEDDYPDFIAKAAKAVSDNPQNSLGIILGGSGQGEAMVANKFRHVRATVYYGGPEEIIKLSHEHNDANVLSLGARFLHEDEARHVVREWLLAHYSLHAKHKRRISKIEQLDVNRNF